MTADDSVHVFVPEFPDFSKRRERLKARSADQQHGVGGNRNWPVDQESSEDDAEDESGSRSYNHQATRAQYSEGSKHMPVSFPPLDPRVNRELFAAQNVPFPYEGTVDVEAQDVESGDESDGSDDAYDSQDEEDQGTGLGSNRPYGAGYGPITGVGSSMNHVVGISWSPSGLGVNRRPILGVLTGSGTLAMFGDGGESANILPRANEGMLQRRELNSWIVLWGVGERLIVPGQQTEVSEYIRGFAWAREIAPGQALLATINDLNEVAIISVQCVLVTDEDKGHVDSSFQAGPRENVLWLVREESRFKAEGPHKETNVGFLPSPSFPAGIFDTLSYLTLALTTAIRSRLGPIWNFIRPQLGSVVTSRRLPYLRFVFYGPWLCRLPEGDDQGHVGQG